MDNLTQQAGWRNWMLAFKLLLNFKRNKAHQGVFREILFRSELVLDRYLPGGKVLGTVVFIHGMSVLGRRDPRIVNLAQALAAAGCRVLIPAFHSIQNLEIRHQQPDEVQQLLELLVADQELCPDQMFSVMAVSFSGVFALRAACSVHLGRRIRCLCLIGGYYDINTVCSFLINANRSDPYGKLLILRNYYREIEPESRAFHQVLDRCIEECIDKKNCWNARTALDTSDSVERRIYRLLTDSLEREIFRKKVIEVFDQGWSGYRTQLDFIFSKTRVLLIHGRDDRVIPAGESRRLARQLVKQKIPVYLCVTRFLSHGDTVIRLSQLLELYRLLGGFAWFFRYSLGAK